MGYRRQSCCVPVFLCLFFFWFLFAGLVCVQDVSGSITGSVQDQRGAVVPNANVTVKNMPRSLVPMVTTDEKGAFVMPHLLPGTYTMRVEAHGFKESTVTTASGRYADGTLPPEGYGVVVAMTGFMTFVRALLGRPVARTCFVCGVVERISLIHSVASVSGHSLLAGTPSSLDCAVLARSAIGRVR